MNAEPKNQAFYVSGLIRDWNKKHAEVCDVLVFEVGDKSDLTDEIIRKIPKENAVMVMDSTKCQEIESREGSFIIIMMNVLSAVSEQKKVQFNKFFPSDPK